MENWNDSAIVLKILPHGESGAVITFISENHGLYAGYLPHATSKHMKACCEIGAHIRVAWQARLQEHLGRISVDLDQSFSAAILHDPIRLQALKSACALCLNSLPDRDPAPEQYHGLLALLSLLKTDNWAPSYVMWEIGFLRGHGFHLDFSRCASTGQEDDLVFVSPKSGRAVSARAGEPYKDKLLALPDFLLPKTTSATTLPRLNRKTAQSSENNVNQSPTPLDEQVIQGLKLTQYFIENWLFGASTRPIPADRQYLMQIMLNGNTN